MNEKDERLSRLQLRYSRVFTSSNLEWGLEHMSGWDKLIDAMSMRIDAILSQDATGEIELLQVKEKFGELRVYYRLKKLEGNAIAAIARAINETQEASTHVCEVCGRPSTLLPNNQMKTRCVTCASTIIG